MKRMLPLLLLCILLAGCTREQRAQRTVFAMDTVMDLQVWAQDADTAAAGAAAVETLLRELEQTWSAADENSALSRFNRGEQTPDQAQQALLDKAQALSVRTGGAFDPRLHSLISAWGFLSGQYRVPSQTELTQALPQKQWNLGAALKGCAGQEAVALLETLGVSRALLNLGGNVQTYGSKPDGEPWQIAIQNPDGGDAVGIVSVEGTVSVVTSGDYQRYFELDGVTYHHILDPRTGYPADTGLRSVTVICADGMTADALSTALYVMGLEQAIGHWQASTDFEAVFILESGEIYATQGAVLSGCSYEVILREN